MSGRKPWVIVAATVAVVGAGGFGAWWLTRDASPDSSLTTLASVATTAGTPGNTALEGVTTEALATSIPATPDTTAKLAWAEEFSDDQVRVLDEFGMPSTFTVVFGTDAGDLPSEAEVHRFEVWDYRDMGVRFLWRDGAVVGTRALARLGPGYDYPAVSPHWFYEGMTFDDVVDVMGAVPTAAGELVPSLSDDFEMAVWMDSIAVSFIDGVIASVQTAPLEVSP